MKQYSFLQEMTPVGLAVGGTMVATSAAASALSWKLAEEIKLLMHQMMTVNSREEAAELLKDCMLYVDNVTGKKTTKAIGIKNGMANLVVGPCMQIVMNESNENWQIDAVKFLRSCIISNRIQAIVFGALGVGTGVAAAAAL